LKVSAETFLEINSTLRSADISTPLRGGGYTQARSVELSVTLENKKFAGFSNKVNEQNASVLLNMSFVEV